MVVVVVFVGGDVHLVLLIHDVDDDSGDDGGVFGGEVHLVVLIHEVVQQPAFVRPAVSSCNWCNDDDDHDDGDDDFY